DRRAGDRHRPSPPWACTAGSATGPARASRLRATELREHLLAEEADLLVPVRAPQLQHDVRAAGVAILLDRLDALCRRPRDRPALVEQRIRDLRLRGEPATLLHRLRDRADLVLLDAGELEQRVRRALDVLHLVREVHPRDLAGAVAAGSAVGVVDRRDDRAADVDLA